MKLSSRYDFDWRRIMYEDPYHIEYCITDICNRNCARCSHLAPLAKRPNFVNTEDFARNVAILKKLVPDAHTFWLTGGEPTLHPDLMRLIEIAADTFCDNFVGVYTNGILLKEREHDTAFWDLVRSRGIVWAVTPYENTREYFEKLFAEHGCLNHLAFVHGGGVFMRLTNYAFDKEVSHEKYIECGWERSKLNVRGGRIYNCPSSEFADLFEERFGVGLKVTNADYLEITADLTRERIDGFKREMPFCSQCDISSRGEVFLSSPSNKEMTEWSDL